MGHLIVRNRLSVSECYFLQFSILKFDPPFSIVNSVILDLENGSDIYKTGYPKMGMLVL